MKIHLLLVPKLTLLLLSFRLTALQAQDYLYTVDNGAVTITHYVGTNASVIIPDTLEGSPVTAIGLWAFQWNTNLQSVTIPNTILTIATGAFYQCTNLTSVTFGDHLASIGESAFYNCCFLPRITFPHSVMSLADNAFASCSRMREIYFTGDAPSLGGSSVFAAIPDAVVYWMPGTTNWSFWFGQHPTALWNPQIQTSDPTFGVQANQFGFIITGTPDIPIVIEACTNPALASWAPLQTSALVNGSLYFRDPQWTNYPARFYRIRSP
jgi:hypothetical protein